MAAERVIDGIQFKLHLSQCHPNFAIQIHPFASPVAPTWFNAALCMFMSGRGFKFTGMVPSRNSESKLPAFPNPQIPGISPGQNPNLCTSRGSQLRTSKDFFMEFSHEMPDPKIATWTGGFQPAKKRGVVLVNA